MTLPSGEHFDLLYEQGLDLINSTLYISGAIKEKSIHKALLGLATMADRCPEINIVLNTPGGDWYQGMALYDSIVACKKHVTITGTGHVMSMGAVILQAADFRQMRPNTVMMIHDGEDGVHTTPRSLEAWTAAGKRQRKQMYDIFAKRSGRQAQYWERKCGQDFVFWPEEALELGLIDKVL